MQVCVTCLSLKVIVGSELITTKELDVFWRESSFQIPHQSFQVRLTKTSNKIILVIFLRPHSLISS